MESNTPDEKESKYENSTRTFNSDLSTQCLKTASCDTCKICFTDKTNFDEPVSTLQKFTICHARKEFKGVYTCVSCGKTSKSECELQFHKHFHTAKSHACVARGKNYFRIYVLKYCRILVREKLFKCELYGKLFNTSYSLRSIHIKENLSDNVLNMSNPAVKVDGHAFKYSDSEEKFSDVVPETYNIKVKVDSDVSKISDTKEDFTNVVTKLHEVHTECGDVFLLNENCSSHSNEGTYKCDICGQCFLKLNAFSIHYSMHIKEKVFECSVCKKKCFNLGAFRTHCKVHTKKGPPNNVNKHSLESGMQSNINEIYKCDVCDKKFRQKGAMIRHSRFHTGERPFVCEICGKGFVEKSSLSQHYFIHTGEKPYQCEVCRKRFNKNSALKKHSFLHMKDKSVDSKPSSKGEMYACKKCNKTFDLKSRLRNHLRYCCHEKSFLCEMCGKFFGAKTSLRQHQLLHTGEKPFGCELCDARFPYKSALVKHCLSHIQTDFH